MILIEDGPKLARIYAGRRILGLLVLRDLKVRYADSSLGYLWSVLEPLLMSLVYWFVFTQILVRRSGEAPYLLFLLSANLAWTWFNAGVSSNLRALRGEAALIRSTNLPREIWILRITCSKAVEFLLSLPVVAVVAILYRKSLHGDVVLFPLAFVMEFVLITGLGLLFAPLSVLVPDVERIVKILLRVMFYLSPVLYGVADVATSTKNGQVTHSQIPKAIQGIFGLNPMAGILSLYRSAFFPRELKWHFVAESAVGTLIVFVIGVYVFSRLESPVLKEI